MLPASVPPSACTPQTVYADGGICLDILQNQWSPIYDVSAILTSIQVCVHGQGCVAGGCACSVVCLVSSVFEVECEVGWHQQHQQQVVRR